MGLPWRYANRVVDELGLVLREEIVWSKLNGLPESVQDRCRRSHEQIFHFTKQGKYYSAIDGVARSTLNRHTPPSEGYDSRGRLPGSVWSIPSEPLKTPNYLSQDGPVVPYSRREAWAAAARAFEARRPFRIVIPEHFAAFPTEIPRRIILGWSPKEVCTGCGSGKRPVVENTDEYQRSLEQGREGRVKRWGNEGGSQAVTIYPLTLTREVTITGYECDCDGTAPTTPGVILDPFGGTGTTAAVARALGRIGLSVDLSMDYCRLAQWRIHDPATRAKVLRVEKPKPQIAGQASLLEELE